MDGKRQIQLNGHDEYLKPAYPVKTYQYGVVAGKNWKATSNLEVFLVPCENDENDGKFEVVARDEDGNEAYMTTSGYYAYFGTKSFYETYSMYYKRQCFSKIDQ